MTSISQTPAAFEQSLDGANNLKTIDFAVVGAASAAVQAASRFLVDRKYVVRGLKLYVGTSGTANTTTCVIRKNGVAITGASVSIAHDVTDGTTRVAAPTSETTVSPGDIIDAELTAVATNNADLIGQILLLRAYD